MADLSVNLPAPLEEELLRRIDVEAKIPAALEALGPVSGRDVVLLDAGRGFRARQLLELGARVTAVLPPGEADAPPPGLIDGAALRVAGGVPEQTALPPASADVVVACWSAFKGPDPDQLAEAERLLRPGGKLLIVQDYGRDDVCALWPEAFEEQVRWSRRNGVFLGAGFRIRVIHCWWTFDSLGSAGELLGEAFGEAGRELAGKLKRPRLAYNVAVYHRPRSEPPGGARPARPA